MLGRCTEELMERQAEVEEPVLESRRVESALSYLIHAVVKLNEACVGADCAESVDFRVRLMLETVEAVLDHGDPFPS